MELFNGVTDTGWLYFEQQYLYFHKPRDAIVILQLAFHLFQNKTSELMNSITYQVWFSITMDQTQ